MVQNTTYETGKAYAFFDVNASPKKLKGMIPKIRDLAQTPNNLELKLSEDVTSLSQDPELLKASQDFDYDYVIEASLPDATNEKTAGELGDIMGGVYSAFYDKGEKFRGEVVYKSGSEYLFRE